MRDPGVRDGREVGIVAEDLLGADDIVNLDEEAASAEPGAQWIDALVDLSTRVQVRV